MHGKKIFIYLACLMLCIPIDASQSIREKILDNGLTVIVKQTKSLQPVCLQLWYNVGAKHEQKSGENGLAHWLEHMTFKGTTTLLSESDIPLVTHKLAGYVNAATSFDWTYYTFQLPIARWHEALPILADCMNNCAFSEDTINSELKVVIQELKMNRDNYKRALIEKMVATVFAGHPYHHPIIGYKHDLWSISRETMLNFYKKHYIPNNAVLVIVGNIDPDIAFDYVDKHFKNIPGQNTYKQQEFNFTKEILTHTVKLYRDIKQPYVLLAFLVPGIKNNVNAYIYDILELLLTRGKQSRLTKKLMEKQNLVTSIHSFNLNLFDCDVFMIGYQPKDISDNTKIIDTINKEINKIYEKTSEDDMKRISKILDRDYYQFLEDNNNQATFLGQNKLAKINNSNFAAGQCKDYNTIITVLKDLIIRYLRPTQMHKGFLLPLPDQEKEEWDLIRQQETERDAQVLAERIRVSSIEEGRYVHSLKEYTTPELDVPIAQKKILPNGLKVIYHHNPSLPIISLILHLKAGSEYDSPSNPGIYDMVCSYLYEGTRTLNAEQLAYQLESNAISMTIKPGYIAMNLLKDDLPKALDILYDIVTNAAFSETSFDKIKNAALARYYTFLDNPQARATQILYEQIYPNHPFSNHKNMNKASLNAISRSDIIEFYKKHFTPHQARLAIVGDLDNYNIENLLEDTINVWNGNPLEDIDFPDLKPVKEQILIERLNKNQIILQFGGLSVSRTSKDFDKLLIFDQIFCQGMNSHLFKLRQKSGAFYTISGSLIAGSGIQPGMTYISTIVSKDRLDEVTNLIKSCIQQAIDKITDQEVEDARQVILTSLHEAYSDNYSIANTFLFLDLYGFSDDYLKHRKKDLDSIDSYAIQEAVKRIFSPESMVIVQAGNL